MVRTARSPPKYARLGRHQPGLTSILLVWLLDTGEWRPRLLIDASNVAELTEVPLESQAQPRDLALPNSVIQSTSPAAQPVAQKQSSSAPFVDPAILSIGKRPQGVAKPELVIVQNQVPETKAPQREAPAARQKEGDGEDLTPTGVTSESLKQLKLVSKPRSALQGQSGGKASEPVTASGPTTEVAAPPIGPSKRRARRRGKEFSGADPVQDEAAPDALPENRGKGWRQTPILQSSESFQPFKSLKAGGRGRRALQNDNGWASEDATDVQEAGDFDFESSLAKFDKSGLFDQMRKDDRTDDADRLVSHNRQAQTKPGPAGGRNLHHSENVLEIPTPTTRQARDAVSDNFWNSEADDGLRNGAERLSGREQGSRQSSRRGESKATTTRRSQSRKASTVASNLGPARVNSGVSRQDLPAYGIFADCEDLVPRSCYIIGTVRATIRSQGRNSLSITDAQFGEHCT
jgi:enhancer of mRNA-decapping protein 3